MWVAVGQSGSIADRIERQIVELIDSKALKAGDRLPPERDLAVTLGVSRPSLREAVKSLEAKGWLVVRHGQGVFVANPKSVDELRAALTSQELTLAELFAMREILEVPAAAWAASVGEKSQVASVRAALAELNSAIESDPPDYALLRTLDAEFHRRIVEAAGNRFLRQTHGVLQSMIAAGMETTLRIPGRIKKSQLEHERLVAAIESGDATGARTQARRHVRAAHAAAIRRIESELRAPIRTGHP
jgi:GntR family transcriptional repressor for pyruvate dehydrogenase complex